MLNLNQLRVFWEMAKSLNFSIAAEKLCVTQPAISKQVKSFEEFCDFKLFIKQRRKIFLTDEGKKLFVYASQIFEMERQLEEVIIGLKNLKHGALRIGTTKAYAQRFIPPLLTVFQKEFPNVIIDLDEGSSLEMTRSLFDFKNSLVIAAKIEHHQGIQFVPIMEEEVLLIAGPDNPLLKKGAINFSDLKGVPIVMKEIGSGTRKLVEEHFVKHNIKPNIFAQTSNMDFIKQMVKMNKAVSFVVRCAVDKDLLDGKLFAVSLKDKRLFLEIYFAYMKDFELPYIAKKFLEFVVSLNCGAQLPSGLQSVLNKLPQSTIPLK
ncbi:LysR substrate binding domain protein [Desulfosarcina cetonica]|uniref:LysR family transcriptional regulator n=1 Tax=Desulfosarcina cetonica TaxID=90730 RepID=UPI0006D29C47|nr:LysR family transcriptional regulator [Desulfosarcina cetonica]VTR70334.1 LysR substrate binding domain protein [Desulfosarcina cetonica]